MSVRKTVGVLVLLWLITMAPAFNMGVEAEGQFVTGEILVKFKPGAQGQAIADLHRDNNASVKANFAELDVQLIEVPAGTNITGQRLS